MTAVPQRAAGAPIWWKASAGQGRGFVSTQILPGVLRHGHSQARVLQRRRGEGRNLLPYGADPDRQSRHLAAIDLHTSTAFLLGCRSSSSSYQVRLLYPFYRGSPARPAIWRAVNVVNPSSDTSWPPNHHLTPSSPNSRISSSTTGRCGCSSARTAWKTTGRPRSCGPGKRGAGQVGMLDRPAGLSSTRCLDP